MTQSGHFDVVIAGGGPGGLSALQWCSDLGLNAVLLEKRNELGGQLLRTYNPITNYLGAKTLDGRELRDVFAGQLLALSDAGRTATEIVAADLNAKRVTTADGTSYSAESIIIATGVRRRRLGVPGERELCGKGVMSSGVKEQNEVAGKRIVIVGGGDAAFENALLLAEREAAHIFVIHRRDEYSARREFFERASNNPKIELLGNTIVKSIEGEGRVERVTLEGVGSAARSMLDADNVLIRIGVQPNTELFHGQLALDAAGYVVIDQNCATSLSDIYAVGDVADPTAPTIAAAVGRASIAVKSISIKRSKGWL